MKAITAILFLASSAITASAFSAVAPKTSVETSAPKSSDPIDRSMRGIDDGSAFDPLEGENPALIRNNNDQVWVPQVSIGKRKKLTFANDIL